MSEWTHAPAPYERLSMLDDTEWDGPGAYVFRRDGGAVYVGGCSSLRQRMGDHRRAGMLTAVTSGALYACADQAAALRLEAALTWLFDPSQNEVRPRPSGPLWAVTLTAGRPIEQGILSWFRSCGHVKVGGHTLVDEPEVATVGCGCAPWAGWLDAARASVDGLTARLAAALDQIASRVEHPHPACAECETNAEDLARYQRWYEERDAEVARLTHVLERVDWTP